MVTPMDIRVNYRRMNHYNTASNQRRWVRTPGGKIVLHHRKKLGEYQYCADSGKKIHGIKRARPCVRPRQKKSSRSISRSYGGYLSAQSLRERILRAFLVEEQKCVKALIAAKRGYEKNKK